MLHDDVRRRLAEDLAWRHPDRYHALRARALTYYRERVRSAPAPEREWLIADRFFLWGNALIQELFFSSDEPGQVWVQPGRSADHGDIRRLFSLRMASLLTPDMVAERLSPPTEDDDFFEAILQYPGTRLRVARDRDGRTLGFSTVLPVCQETIPLLDLHPAYAPLVHKRWSRADLAALPPSSDGATIFHLLHLVYLGETAGAIRAALLRDLAGVFATSGIYLSSTFVPGNKRMLEACGFERLPAARNEAWGPAYPVDGYVLDLSHIGFEPWIEALMNGRRPPRTIDPAELETELHAAFRHWSDDRWLAQSRLNELTVVGTVEAESQRPAAVRRAVLQWHGHGQIRGAGRGWGSLSRGRTRLSFGALQPQGGRPQPRRFSRHALPPDKAGHSWAGGGTEPTGLLRSRLARGIASRKRDKRARPETVLHLD
jgi:hypothetical protein